MTAIALNRLRENFTFLRHWARNPRVVGSITPSSPAIGRFMGRYIVASLNDGYVIEIGGGTGSLTQGLIEVGVAEERLVILEINPKFASALKKRFPSAIVIQGDAQHLSSLLPDHIRENVSAIVSGLPFVSLPNRVTKNIVKAIFRVLPESGKFYQFSYRFYRSPIAARMYGFEEKRLGTAFFNIPPAAIWEFTKVAYQFNKTAA